MTSYKITSEYIGNSELATLAQIRAIVADWNSNEGWSEDVTGWQFEVREHGDEIRVYAEQIDSDVETPRLFRDWIAAGEDYYIIVAERHYSLDEIHNAARAKLAAGLGVKLAELPETLSRIGVRYAIDTDGTITLTPARRLDTIQFDDVAKVFEWMCPEYRLYIEAQVTGGDVQSMTDAYKLDALLLHREFMQWAYDPMHNAIPPTLVFERDAEQRIRDGAYLYRIGYRAYESRPYADYEQYTLPDDHLWIFTIEVFSHISADHSRRYYVTRGLYRVENVATQTTALSEVLTLAEASEIYEVDATTIRVSIHKGYVAARKSGGTWLIARADAERRWKRRGTE